MILGADISYWQGNIDWKALDAWLQASHPLQFFMLRTEDGLNKDGRFSSYCNGLNILNFYDIGTYFYFRASKPIREQVRQAVDMHGDLPGPFAVDMETLDGVDPHLAADATFEALAYASSQLGRKAMLYTDAGDWGRLGAWGKVPHFADFPLWLAAVTEDPARKTFVPPPWTEAPMRQYTFSRKIPGISANVDGDAFYGTIEEWRNLGR